MAPRLSRANLHLLCSQPLQLLTYLGARETFTSFEVFTQRTRVPAGPPRLASSRALTRERERSRLRLLTASLTTDLAFNIPPLRPQPLNSFPPQVSSACFGNTPPWLTSSLHLGSWLLGSPSSSEPPANPLPPSLASVFGRGPRLTSLLLASLPFGPLGHVTSR